METLDSYRQVIPRWVLFHRACETMVGKGVKSVLSAPDGARGELDRLRRDWTANKSMPYALDLLGVALFSDEEPSLEAKEAAKLVFRETNEGDVRRELASVAVDRDAPLTQNIFSVASAGNVKVLRDRLKRFPRDPTTWMDLGFHLALLGNLRNARRCVAAAVGSGGAHPFILRSASRFFIHAGDPREALHLLRGSSLSRSNPWIVSADIAISDGFRINAPKVSVARGILGSGRYSAFELSEIRSALATIEFGAGSGAKARKLVGESLIEPTENALAQAFWAAGRGLVPGVSVDPKNRVNAFEARARNFVAREKHGQALEQCFEWLKFQPLSARPAAFGSFVAAVFLERHEEALKLIDLAFPASGNVGVLHNNKAFSLVSLGQIEGALKEVECARSISSNRVDSGVLEATMGLIEFRRGDVEEGRACYKRAYHTIRKDELLLGLLCYYWLREEIRIGSVSLADAGVSKLEVKSEKDARTFAKVAKILLKL